MYIKTADTWKTKNIKLYIICLFTTGFDQKSSSDIKWNKNVMSFNNKPETYRYVHVNDSIKI